MWPWNRRVPAQDDLRTRVADLEADNRRLRAEWKDILDRLLRMDERARKREERAGVERTPETAQERKAVLRLKVRSNAPR